MGDTSKDIEYLDELVARLEPLSESREEPGAQLTVDVEQFLRYLRPRLTECEYHMTMEVDDPVWETGCGHSLVCEEWLLPRDILFCAYCGGRVARVCRCPVEEKTGETQLEPGGPMVCNLCGSPDPEPAHG